MIVLARDLSVDQKPNQANDTRYQDITKRPPSVLFALFPNSFSSTISYQILQVLELGMI